MDNIKTIKLNAIYKFDSNKYVVKRLFPRKYTGGIKKQIEYVEQYYVYEFDDEGRISRCVYGRLVDKPMPYDINKEFMIMTYRNEEAIVFEITMPLQVANYSDLQMVTKEVIDYNSVRDEYMGKRK